MSVGSRLQPFFFDALHVGGESLIDRPLSERKAVLADVVPHRLLLPTIDTPDAERRRRSPSPRSTPATRA